VLDNVPRPGAGGNPAEPLLVKAPGVATLLTTRFREAVPAGVQQAFNEAVDSPVSRAAKQQIGTAEEPGRWLEWLNRPLQWVPPACLMVLRGHTRPVTSVAFTAGGRTAVSAGDYTLRVWDLAGGRCTAVLEGHAKGVERLAVSADGQTAVSAAGDNTLRVWDLAGGRNTAVLEGHTAFVKSVAVTADGRTAVSAAGDNTLRVWDLARSRCTAVLAANTEWVSGVAVTPDGRTAVLRGYRSTVVWDLAGGRFIASHVTESEGAKTAWATAAGHPKTVDQDLHGLTLRSPTGEAVIARFPGSFTSADGSPDGRHVVAGDGRGGVYLLRLHERRS
jgi:WD40 repeat protein